MSLVITGATGHLGHLVVESLLARGVPAADIVAAGRTVSKAKDLADRGVLVRGIDYADPATLDGLFHAGDKVVLVSGTELGQRVPQHQNVINAAASASVALLAYTSIANAESSTLRLAAEHQATEAAIRASGLPFTLLRNSWYIENYTGQIASVLQHGALLGSAGQGRVSGAARADYAAAAAAVATGTGHEGRAYELGGDPAFTLAEVAAEIGAQTGRDIAYQDLPEAGYRQVLTSAGVPQPVAEILADSDRGLARGDLLVAGDDLRRLTGRPSTTLHDAVASALRGL